MSQPNSLPETPSLQQLCPERVRALATTVTMAEFVTAFGASPLLLVRLHDRVDELEVGLRTVKDQPDHGRNELGVLGFHTLLGDRSSEVSHVSSTGQPEAVALRQRLSEARHFAVEIEKRAGDGSYVHRIAVGRARNKDILLRHPSVSKFHAWFEVDPELGLQMADAGSRNGTLKNDVRLRARELTTIQSGDVLRFGAVEAVLCAAETLWHAVATSA